MSISTKTYVYKKVEPEQELTVDVHYDAKSSSASLPIAYLIHGGGFTLGGKEHIPAYQIRILVELGFVVVSVNYRLCPTISMYDGPITDCLDCLTWCRSSLPAILAKDARVTVDPHRLVTMGHSAGGLLAMFMGTHNEPPLAILDFYGTLYLSDEFWHLPNPNFPSTPVAQEILDQIWSEIPPPSSVAMVQSEIESGAMSLSTSRHSWLMVAGRNGNFMRDIVRDGDYARVDPTSFFSEKSPPAFFIHGKADTIVPSRFSVKAYESLKDLGVEAEIRLLDDDNHAFDETIKDGTPQMAIVREGLEFLARHAKTGS